MFFFHTHHRRPILPLGRYRSSLRRRSRCHCRLLMAVELGTEHTEQAYRTDESVKRTHLGIYRQFGNRSHGVIVVDILGRGGIRQEVVVRRTIVVADRTALTTALIDGGIVCNSLLDQYPIECGRRHHAPVSRTEQPDLVVRTHGAQQVFEIANTLTDHIFDLLVRQCRHVVVLDTLVKVFAVPFGTEIGRMDMQLHIMSPTDGVPQLFFYLRHTEVVPACFLPIATEA